MATTITNAAPQVASYTAPAAGIKTTTVDPVQVGQLPGYGNDQLLVRPRPIDVSQFIKPSLEQLQGNVLKASVQKAFAQQRVDQAQQAYDSAKTPFEKFAARQALDSAKRGLQDATVGLDKANVALARRKADDADQAVANAEKAVQGASNPFSRMLAIKQLEAAVRKQTQAHDDLGQAEGQLFHDEIVNHPFEPQLPVIWENSSIPGIR